VAFGAGVTAADVVQETAAVGVLRSSRTVESGQYINALAANCPHCVTGRRPEGLCLEDTDAGRIRY
jgi:hypothetical protein